MREWVRVDGRVSERWGNCSSVWCFGEHQKIEENWIKGEKWSKNREQQHIVTSWKGEENDGGDAARVRPENIGKYFIVNSTYRPIFTHPRNRLKLIKQFIDSLFFSFYQSFNQTIANNLADIGVRLVYPTTQHAYA